MEKDLQERKWKVLSSEYVHRDTWLTARRDCVQLPTGAIIPKYYILEYPEWVTTIAITKDKQFVFVRQYRHGIGETRYELCAGVCDPDDASPEAAARRELWEETGFGGGSWREVMVISANASAMTNHTHCFVATDVERISEPHQEQGEEIDRLRLPDIPVIIDPGHNINDHKPRSTKKDLPLKIIHTVFIFDQCGISAGAVEHHQAKTYKKDQHRNETIIIVTNRDWACILFSFPLFPSASHRNRTL